MDVNLKVPLSAITTPINRLAKRATTHTEKTYLYEIVEALGAAINTGPQQGFNKEEFVTACGVSSDWAAAA
jgi:hypothetical protein